ncbi:mitochondrial amidoxime-reducing component 1-like [Littorina saxatilis]|uniref:MOSC domain-containing protein n=1 Tax=Littorina saxatilis TaxID=31220 RepID=A0AAN9BM79_9CAEN
MALQEALTTREGATFTALVVGSALKYLWMSKVRAARGKLFQLVGHVAELCVYPMKGCRAVQLQSAKATITGLTSGGFHDRWWMMEYMAGTPVTMKTEPRLTLVTFTIDGDWLVVSAPDMTPLRLPVHPDPASYPIKSLKIYGIEMNVLECGPEANDWFSRYIGQTVLVYHSRPGIGTHDTYEHPLGWDTDARKGDRTVFAYLTAYLLTTTASLSELNHRLDSPVSSRHFRPNIVVQNSLPFDEDNWEEIRIGNNAKFHYVQPCRR